MNGHLSLLPRLGSRNEAVPDTRGRCHLTDYSAIHAYTHAGLGTGQRRSASARANILHGYRRYAAFLNEFERSLPWRGSVWLSQLESSIC